LFAQSLLAPSGQVEEDGDFLQPDDVVVSLQYVSELESVALVCAGGTLMTMHVASRQLDVVGCMTGAVAAAAWSPDQVDFSDHGMLDVGSACVPAVLITLLHGLCLSFRRYLPWSPSLPTEPALP
jgi:hypothetical protein